MTFTKFVLITVPLLYFNDIRRNLLFDATATLQKEKKFTNGGDVAVINRKHKITH